MLQQWQQWHFADLVCMGACRTKVAGQFREGSGLTMFTSDVSARGVDYPDVSLVLQVPACCLNGLTYA